MDYYEASRFEYKLVEQYKNNEKQYSEVVAFKEAMNKSFKLNVTLQSYQSLCANYFTMCLQNNAIVSRSVMTHTEFFNMKLSLLYRWLDVFNQVKDCAAKSR